METFLGVTLVMIAGLGTGSIAWPMKIMRRLEFEHYWFVGMLAGLIIVPWSIVLVGCPNALEAYAEVGWKPLMISNLFAIGWGVANVLYGICVIRIGAALTAAILSGLGMTVGITLPMVFKGTGMFSEAPDLMSKVGLVVMAGVAVLLAGVVVSTMAGFGRERQLKRAAEPDRGAAGGFLGALILVIIAGVTSCGIAMAFVYSQGPVVEAMKAHGAGAVSANVAVWAVGLMGGALINVLYPAFLMSKNQSWGVLTQCWRDVGLGAIIGIQFIFAVVLLGRGMVMLGPLGASIGFGIQQAMQIMGNQGVGFFSGEWRGVRGVPRLQMYAAIAILIAGVVVLAFAQTLDVT